jgi:hypothetical protein
MGFGVRANGVATATPRARKDSLGAIRAEQTNQLLGLLFAIWKQRSFAILTHIIRSWGGGSVPEND